MYITAILLSLIFDIIYKARQINILINSISINVLIRIHHHNGIAYFYKS